MPFPTQPEIDAFCKNCDSRQADGSCSLDRGHDKPFVQDIQILLGIMLKDAVTRTAAAQGETLSAKAENDLTMRAMGATNQSRYAARNWCGWASVDGKRGNMTKEGFDVKE